MTQKRYKHYELVTEEKPYFKQDSSKYVAKPMFFGASFIYFVARVIGGIVRSIKRLFGRGYTKPSPSPFAATDTAVIPAAASKLYSHNRATGGYVIVDEYRERFADEGVVYRP